MGKYDLPESITKYTSRFVDPGLESFKLAAQNYSDRFDKNKQSADMISAALETEEFMPGEDAELRDLARDKINSLLGDVAETGAYHTADMAVNKAAHYYTADPDLTLARRNAKEYQKTVSMYDTYGENGVYDPQKDFVSNFKSISVNPDGKTSRNIYKNKAQKVEDYNAAAQALIGTISADSGPWAGYGFDEIEALENYLLTGQEGGVSQPKLDNMVANLVDEYKMTPAGAQLHDRFANSNQNPLRQAVGDAEADNQLLNTLKNVGQNQVRSNRTMNAPSSDSIQGPVTPHTSSAVDYATSIFIGKKKGVGLGLKAQIAATGATAVQTPAGGGYTASGSAIVLDLAQTMSPEQAKEILLEVGPVFDNVEDPIEVIQTLNMLFIQDTGFNDKTIGKAMQDLGVENTPENQKVVMAISKNISGVINAKLAENLGVANPFGSAGTIEGTIFVPNANGGFQRTGGALYPKGTLYIPTSVVKARTGDGWWQDFFNTGSKDIEVDGHRVFSHDITIDGVDYVSAPGYGPAINYLDPKVADLLNTQLYTDADRAKMRSSSTDLRSRTVSTTAKIDAVLRPSVRKDALAFGLTNMDIALLDDGLDRYAASGQSQILNYSSKQIVQSYITTRNHYLEADYDPHQAAFLAQQSVFGLQ